MRKVRFFNIKVKGFTIIELIVSLIVTSIIVMIVGAALILTQKQILKFSKDSSKTYSQTELLYLIQKDFELSDSIFYENNSIVFFYPLHKVEYSIGDIVFRNNFMAVDTFNIKIIIDEVKQENNLVTSVKIDFIEENRSHSIVFYKEYSPNIYIEHITL